MIVSDSFGRPFRHGTTDVAIGIAGVPALIDLRGTLDRGGRVLQSSLVAVADQIAGAADLARGKASGVPVVVVRGLDLSASPPGEARRGASWLSTPSAICSDRLGHRNAPRFPNKTLTTRAATAAGSATVMLDSHGVDGHRSFGG